MVFNFRGNIIPEVKKIQPIKLLRITFLGVQIMSSNTKTLLELLADKLSLQFKSVKKWYKTNKYDTQQLEVINRQVTNDDIVLYTLISAIENNSQYRISIY